MYHVGQPTKRRHKLRRLLVALGLCVVVAGVIGARQMTKSDTVVHQGMPTTTQVSVATAKTVPVSKPSFTVNLPKDWIEVSEASAYTRYSWEGTGKTDNARRLDVYVDNLPTELAVNRLLPVQAEADGVSTTGSISDNCINFTDKNTANTQTGSAPAKWSGVSFLCDTANTIREVTGTGSPDGINTVILKGASGTPHRFFFVYTDHTAQADFDVFTDILATFKAR